MCHIGQRRTGWLCELAGKKGESCCSSKRVKRKINFPFSSKNSYSEDIDMETCRIDRSEVERRYTKRMVCVCVDVRVCVCVCVMKNGWWCVYRLLRQRYFFPYQIRFHQPSRVFGVNQNHFWQNFLQDMFPHPWTRSPETRRVLGSATRALASKVTWDWKAALGNGTLGGLYALGCND